MGGVSEHPHQAVRLTAAGRAQGKPPFRRAPPWNDLSSFPIPGRSDENGGWPAHARPERCGAGGGLQRRKSQVGCATHTVVSMREPANRALHAACETENCFKGPVFRTLGRMGHRSEGAPISGRSITPCRREARDRGLGRSDDEETTDCTNGTDGRGRAWRFSISHPCYRCNPWFDLPPSAFAARSGCYRVRRVPGAVFGCHGRLGRPCRG